MDGGAGVVLRANPLGRQSRVEVDVHRTVPLNFQPLP
jgi:hypothetical protein